jgi:hypothetical protein
MKLHIWSYLFSKYNKNCNEKQYEFERKLIQDTQTKIHTIIIFKKIKLYENR